MMMDSSKGFSPYPEKLIGFYPIVPDFKWLVSLVEWGARTVQLRVKRDDLAKRVSKGKGVEDTLREEIARSCDYCRKRDVKLMINDHWMLAEQFDAFGVHLGQEDLDQLSSDDRTRLKESGMIVGISTHSWQELERALELKPSYIALGPIFPTTCKSLAFGPHGLERIREWVERTPLPVVAIGGMRAEHIVGALEKGASGIAVISDILEDPRPEQKVHEWLRVIGEFHKNKIK